MEHIIVEYGSLENCREPILLVKNSRTWDDSKQPCPHCHSPIKIIHTRGWDLSTWEEISWTNPFVAMIPYDGDCCHTAVCVKCLMDGIKKSGVNTELIGDHKIDQFENIPVFTNIETCLLEKDGWIGAGGCIWTKDKDRLGYREKENEGWNLNGKPIEFMEDLKIITKEQLIDTVKTKK